jgi:hypothetical protein
VVPVGSPNLNLRLKLGAGVPPKGADWPSAAILRWHPYGAQAPQKSRVVGHLKLLRNFKKS